ncbi:MAG: hypothetical protein H6720_11310 [Sandaracinus sp.]|nr:hypothetical protein [Sandaracinus sp.]
MLLRSLVLVALFASTTSAQSAQVTSSNVGSSPPSTSWLPIVRVGYRAQLTRYPSRGVGYSPSRHAHGFTTDVLMPVLTTGAPGALRFGLAFGSGLDFAYGPGIEDGSVIETDTGPIRLPGDEPGSVATLLFYGQVAAVLRAGDRNLGFLGTLAWQPTWRGSSYVNQTVLGRGRLTLGLTRGLWQVGAFLGLAKLEDEPSEPREIDFGLQLGTGW